jgi:hypothetical protein
VTSTATPEGAHTAVVDQLAALLTLPGGAPALQSAFATKHALLRRAEELAGESGLGLTTSDIKALADPYAKTGHAALDTYNVALHVRSDLRMMINRGDVDAAVFLRRAIQGSSELNAALAHRSATAKARFDWMMDLADSRTV